MGCYKPSKTKEIENEIKFNEPIIIEKIRVNPQIFESIKSERTEIKNYLQYIKSKYILKQIFNYLQKKNQLKIMKYNNKIKERLNINLVDYKNYSDIIEIDIIPVDNNYGKFINILKLKEKPYFHIFLRSAKDQRKHFFLFFKKIRSLQRRCKGWFVIVTSETGKQPKNKEKTNQNIKKKGRYEL
jgi:hypothetical protein